MNNNHYKVKGKEIIFNTEVVARFNHHITKTIEYDNMIFVLLKTLGVLYNENVFAVDQNGRILWQIEMSDTINKLAGECPYTDMEIRGNKLSLFNFCGFRTTAEPETGKILEERFVK